MSVGLFVCPTASLSGRQGNPEQEARKSIWGTAFDAKRKRSASKRSCTLFPWTLGTKKRKRQGERG